MMPHVKATSNGNKIRNQETAMLSHVPAEPFRGIKSLDISGLNNCNELGGGKITQIRGRRLAIYSSEIQANINQPQVQAGRLPRAGRGR